jgi:A/G-specific adenine glycosylase
LAKQSRTPETKQPTGEQVTRFRNDLITWYHQHGRRFPWRNKSVSSYGRIIAEILLQRTQAGTVARFFPGFLDKYPSWKKLAQATEEELQKEFKPIGLWQRRAASLKRLASEIAHRHGRFPRERKDIEALPGIGQYIANAVLLFCHGEAQPLLDASMARVLERYFGPRKLVDIRYDPYLQALAQKVVSGENPDAINWAILDHAALVCQRKEPMCYRCPLNHACRYALQHFHEV